MCEHIIPKFNIPRCLLRLPRNRPRTLFLKADRVKSAAFTLMWAVPAVCGLVQVRQSFLLLLMQLWLLPLMLLLFHILLLLLLLLLILRCW